MATTKSYSNVSIFTNQALKLYNTADSHFVSLKAPSAQGADFALVLPGSDTTNGAVVSDGSGNLSIALIVNANVAAAAAIAVSKLSAGTNGQVITTVAGVPTWATPAASSAPSSPELITNYSVVNSVGSNALTIALKDAAGADPTGGSPVTIPFRDSTLATGDTTVVTVTAALSITIPSGTTIGTVSAQQSYIYLYALNNAGTVELAVVAGTLYDEQLLQTTTAISGGSTIFTLYSTTARSSVAVRYLGRLLVSETTAGTWTVVATEISINRLAASIAQGVNSYNSSAGLMPPRSQQMALVVSGNHSWSTSRAVGIIYQDGNHVWRIKFNIDGSTASNAQTSITITGIVFNNSAAIAIYTNQTASNNFAGAGANSGTGTIDMFSASASTTSWRVAGDVELSGQPTI